MESNKDRLFKIEFFHRYCLAHRAKFIHVFNWLSFHFEIRNKFSFILSVLNSIFRLHLRLRYGPFLHSALSFPSISSSRNGIHQLNAIKFG